MNSWTKIADGVADEVDVFVLQAGAEERFQGDHREGDLHQGGE